jgi:hypothetical protein
VASTDPLSELITSFRGQQAGPTVTYLFTDDAHRETLPESLRAATRDDGEAVVFLTPSVLFDTETLSNPALAYDRFVEFERFRRSLASDPRVTVYEVGPGDELAAVLAAVGGRRGRPSRRVRGGAAAPDAPNSPPAPSTSAAGGGG